MEAEDLIQHVRVGQEGVGDNAELSAAVEMTNGAADQGLRGFQAGLQTVVERRVGDDHVETAVYFGEHVAGEHFPFDAVSGERSATGFYCRRADVA